MNAVKDRHEHKEDLLKTPTQIDHELEHIQRKMIQGDGNVDWSQYHDLLMVRRRNLVKLPKLAASLKR